MAVAVMMMTAAGCGKESFKYSGRKCFDTSNLADTVFYGFSDKCFHFLRGSTIIGNAHTNQRQVNVRCEVNANIRIATDTEYYQH